MTAASSMLRRRGRVWQHASAGGGAPAAHPHSSRDYRPPARRPSPPGRCSAPGFVPCASPTPPSSPRRCPSPAPRSPRPPPAAEQPPALALRCAFATHNTPTRLPTARGAPARARQTARPPAGPPASPPPAMWSHDNRPRRKNSVVSRCGAHALRSWECARRPLWAQAFDKMPADVRLGTQCDTTQPGLGHDQNLRYSS